MTRIFEISVGNMSGDLTGDTNIALQAAVDIAAEMGGGIVNILPGVYTMNDSLHLRSGVTLRGSGDDTILLKSPCVKSKVIHYLGYGHLDVSVAEPEKFKIGMGVYITDEHSGGFYSTVATINWIKGNDLGITRMLNSDISAGANGEVISVYPIISGYNVDNVSIENLVIDGNAEENEYINGCRGGGIFLLGSNHVAMRGVTVGNFNGDGISYQQCRHTLVENCSCIGNRGHGMHPGSGSVGSIIRNTVIRNNGFDGIYYCLRVSYSLCEDCTIENNGRNGISIGHRDTDALIRRNQIASNDLYGVYFRTHKYNLIGDRTILESNHIYSNCKRTGNAQICMDSTVEDVYILNNSFGLESDDIEVEFAVYVNACPKNLVINGNQVSKGDLLTVIDNGFNEHISLEKPKALPNVGVESIPEDADRHLMVR